MNVGCLLETNKYEIIFTDMANRIEELRIEIYKNIETKDNVQSKLRFDVIESMGRLS